MIRMEIACFMVLAFVALIYFSAGRRTSRLHKTFALILCAVLVNLIFDGITIFTVNRLGGVPTILNDALHRFFVGTMVLTLFLFYSYISFLVEEETGKKQRMLYFPLIFLIAAELGAMLLPVEYTVTPAGNYSSGAYAYSVYASLIVYIILCAVMLFANRKKIHSKKKFAIGAALIIEIAISVCQAINPTWLISGMGLTLMVLAFYLTLENPDIIRGELNEQKISMLYLKSQVNPHFLYNTIDSIRIQAELNNDKATAELLMKLAEFFRLSVKTDKTEVMLDDEIELADTYLELMRFRYPKLSVDYDIEPELGDCLVPNFILQPLVENSLLHGLKNKGYAGEIRISAKKCSDGCLEITVSDSGSGFTDESRERVRDILENYGRREQRLDGSSIGILNVQKRVTLLCGRAYGLSYTENEGGGVAAHLKLPFKTEDYR